MSFLDKYQAVNLCFALEVDACKLKTSGLSILFETPPVSDYSMMNGPDADYTTSAALLIFL